MLVQALIAAGGRAQVWSNVRSMIIVGQSNGATFSVDAGGFYSLSAGQLIKFEPKVISDTGFHQYPDIAVTPGSNAPTLVVFDMFDDRGPIHFGTAAAPSNQEGDLVPTATGPGSQTLGTTGAPVLHRGPGNVFTLSSVDANGNLGVQSGFTVAKPVLIRDTGVVGPPAAMGSVTLSSPFDKIYGTLTFVTAGSIAGGIEVDFTVNGKTIKQFGPAIGAAGTFYATIAWGVGLPPATYQIPGSPNAAANITVPAQAGLTSVELIVYETY